MSDGHSDGPPMGALNPRVLVCYDQTRRSVHTGDYIWYVGWAGEIDRAQVVGFGSHTDKVVGNPHLVGRTRHYIKLSGDHELYLDGPIGSSTKKIILC